MAEERARYTFFPEAEAYHTEDIKLWMDVKAHILASKSYRNFLIGYISTAAFSGAISFSIVSHVLEWERMAVISTILLFIFFFYTVQSCCKSYMYFLHAEELTIDNEIPESFWNRLCLYFRQQRLMYSCCFGMTITGCGVIQDMHSVPDQQLPSSAKTGPSKIKRTVPDRGVVFPPLLLPEPRRSTSCPFHGHLTLAEYSAQRHSRDCPAYSSEQERTEVDEFEYLTEESDV